MSLANKIQLKLFYVLFVAGIKLIAQDTINTSNLEQFIENISEQTNSEDNDLSNLFDELIYYRLHPINLNKTNAEELLSLHILNEIQVNSLLRHIGINGTLFSIYELQSIEGFDLPLIYSILPYITIIDSTPAISFKEILKNGNHRLISRTSFVLEPQKGYTNDLADNYSGTKYKVYNRYRYSYANKLSFGITGEKDAGESFLKEAQKHGFDFYSGHLFYQPDKRIKAFIIGDYVLNFGQGLALWQGFAFSKSNDVIATKKITNGIRPYLSTDENRFMRGAAVTFKQNCFEFTTFASHHPIDATINFADSATQSALSIQESGLHRTLREIENKHSIKQSIYGGNLTFKKNNFKSGLTYMHTRLNIPLVPATQPYSFFYFSGNNINNTSADYSYSIKNIIFWGEAALSYQHANEKNAGYAYINGIIAALDPKVSVSLIHRNYSRSYHSFFSNGFGEGSRTNNENGIYAGIQLKITQSLTLNSYYDRYTFPWLKYRVNAPSEGEDYFTQLEYTPSKRTTLYLRYKNEKSYQNVSGENYLGKVKKQNIRVNGTFIVNRHITLKSRIEFVILKNAEGNTENGNVIIQDIIVYKKPFTVYLRYALFETPGYESRIYAYENDMPGVWSSPAYYYKGSRAYCMLKIKTSKKINFWMRYSRSFYTNKDVLSEGSLDEINGNTKSEIKMQLDVAF